MLIHMPHRLGKYLPVDVNYLPAGHSFPGRNTATSSMQISVHKMKDIDVDMNCQANALGCITTQAGVQWGEAYREVRKCSSLQ